MISYGSCNVIYNWISSWIYEISPVVTCFLILNESVDGFLADTFKSLCNWYYDKILNRGENL